MSLSRCGRQYPDFPRALLSAELRSEKSNRAYVVEACQFGDHWHVITAKNSLAITSRPDPFPPAIRGLLVKRDGCCQRCGFTGRLEAHHRRAKASGGSKARSHTQCTCNGVLVCRRCHEFIHLNPRKARADGWTVLQSVSSPGSIGVIRTAGVGPWPTCDGRWVSDAPE